MGDCVLSKRKMRLLFISNLFPDQREPWRGLDNVTLLHALKKEQPHLETRVLAFRPSLTLGARQIGLQPRTEDVVLNPSYHSAVYVPKFGGCNHRFFEWSLTRALRHLEGFRPDVILAPWLFPDSCAVAACFAGVPLVSVAQGSDVHQYLTMPMRRHAILRMCKRARAVVTRSRDLENRLAAAGADATRLHTVYNGVHMDVFRPSSRPEARRLLGIPDEERLLLFVGNFLPVKGIELLIDAMAIVASQHQNISLALVGSGPLEQSLRNQAEALGLSNRLRFAGRQPPVEVAQWMQAADVVCLSSHNEGVPNVVLEAVSTGRPLVSTDVGGIAEIVEPAMTRRFLVSGRNPNAYANALNEALVAPPDELVLHQKATQYSWPNCARNYLDLMTSA